MSYVYTLSEIEELTAWEEGRLQGLKDAQTQIQIMLDAQQAFLDEFYGDDESE